MATPEQIAEGELRMEQLTKAFHLNEKLLKYLKEGRLYYSYMNSGILGCIDTIEYDQNYARLCREFEERSNVYVYHAIETRGTRYGDLLAMLYVSSNKSNWQIERLESDYIYAYVYNLTSDYGEMGDIFLASNNGALYRTA